MDTPCAVQDELIPGAILPGMRNAGHVFLPRASCAQVSVGGLVEIALKMRDDVARVVLGAENESGLTTAQHGQTDRVESRRLHDAAVVTQVSFVIDDRHVEPAVLRAKARRPD